MKLLYYCILFGILQNAQAKELDSLEVFTVESSDLHIVLNEIVQHERECDYYNLVCVLKLTFNQMKIVTGFKLDQ